MYTHKSYAAYKAASVINTRMLCNNVYISIHNNLFMYQYIIWLLTRLFRVLVNSVC